MEEETLIEALQEIYKLLASTTGDDEYKAWLIAEKALKDANRIPEG